MVDDDYEKVLRELRFKQVSEAFKKNRKERVNRLEEIGFTWIDDEDDQEKIEELRGFIGSTF